MKVRIYRPDALFSQYIRTRDKKCVRCGSLVEFNSEGKPVSHQASHYWGRGNWNTRFDEENVDTLDFACHRLWGGDYRRDYEKFKRKQLGEKGYQMLEIRAHSYAKRDLKLALMYVKELIKISEVK